MKAKKVFGIALMILSVLSMVFGACFLLQGWSSGEFITSPITLLGFLIIGIINIGLMRV